MATHPDRPPIPGEPGYVDATRRGRWPYIGFMVLEFWLAVAGVILLILGPWIAGAVILGVVALLFVVAMILGS